MVPDILGHLNRICFPSILPTQFGKFHLSKNSKAIVLNLSTVGVGICLHFNVFQIALHTSTTIFETVVLDILNEKAICLNASPVAKNLLKTQVFKYVGNSFYRTLYYYNKNYIYCS